MIIGRENIDETFENDNYTNKVNFCRNYMIGVHRNGKVVQSYQVQLK